MAPAGSIAMGVSQSGALGQLFDYAKDQQLGFSKFISLGNKPWLMSWPVLQYLEQDPNSVTFTLCRALIRLRPGLTTTHHRSKHAHFEAAKSTAGAVRCRSHTGSLGQRDNLSGFFRQSGCCA